LLIAAQSTMIIESFRGPDRPRANHPVNPSSRRKGGQVPGWYDDDDPALQRFRRAWDSIHIVRGMPYSLFTFGESQLPYYIVVEAASPGKPVTVRQGEVRVTRPLIITAHNSEPELQGFFDADDADDAAVAQFLLSRTASFSHLRLQHSPRGETLMGESASEIIAKLERQLDADEEDRMAILTAPARYANLAVLKYAAERIASSAHDNVTELRERGFLP
jgi:hypothetical protein